MALTPFHDFGLRPHRLAWRALGDRFRRGSFSVLIGAHRSTSRPINAVKAAGIINAGGIVGAIRFRSVAQALIQMLGWMGAMWSLA